MDKKEKLSPGSVVLSLNVAFGMSSSGKRVHLILFGKNGWEAICGCELSDFPLMVAHGPLCSRCKDKGKRLFLLDLVEGYLT